MERCDEHPEVKVWFAKCLGEACPWEDEANHESPDHCAVVCPVCGADTEIHEDYQGA